MREDDDVTIEMSRMHHMHHFHGFPFLMKASILDVILACSFD